jgi:hypothetical protein
MFNKKHIIFLTILFLLSVNSLLGVSNPLYVTRSGDDFKGSKYADFNTNTSSNRVFVCWIGNDKWDGLNPIWNGTSGPKKPLTVL